MTQNERLDFLLHYLIKERKEYENIRVPVPIQKSSGICGA